MSQSGNIHDLYHEAKLRASQPQAVTKYRVSKSLLLSAPNNIIFELFNTVIREVPGDILLEFITTNLKDYLYTNWNGKITQQVIKRLRREQVVDSRAGLKGMPTIAFIKSTPLTFSKTKESSSSKLDQNVKSLQSTSSPKIKKNNSSKSLITISSKPQLAMTGQKSPPLDCKQTTDKQTTINQIYEHVIWRIKTENVSQITSLLIKLVIDDGYKRNKLKADLYDDVAECFEDWRSRKLIKLYAFGSAPANDQKLILANTTRGDLTKWVANYIDGSEKRQKPDLIRKLVSALRDKTKNCIFITNELLDALNSIETGSIRCAFVVDRLNQCEPLEAVANFKTLVEPLLISGKLYVMSSLDCVEFAPDPSNDTCC